MPATLLALDRAGSSRRSLWWGGAGLSDSMNGSMRHSRKRSLRRCRKPESDPRTALGESATIRSTPSWEKGQRGRTGLLPTCGLPYQTTNSAVQLASRRAGRSPADHSSCRRTRVSEILQGISHPGILKAIDFREDERGPALIFEHDPAAQRLDSVHARTRCEPHRRGSPAPPVETSQKRFVTRTKSICSIAHSVPRPSSSRPWPACCQAEVQIFSWQAGSRAAGTGTAAGAISATAHPDQLVEDATTVYMAPEAHIGSDTGERLDVFSLGALVWFVFTGRPPADSLLGLTERLREGGGLRLSSVMNGANRQLEELVQYATQPAVSDRLNAVTEVLYYLDLAEKELLPKSAEPVFDPTEARAGDELPGGFVVVRRLGKGSTAMALLASRNGKECVLKVALSPNRTMDSSRKVRSSRSSITSTLFTCTNGPR